MALDVYIPVYPKDKENILKRADNTNTELNRLKNLNSAQDLSSDYLDVYNSDIPVTGIDQEFGSAYSVSTVKGDTTKAQTNQKNIYSSEQLIDQNSRTNDGQTTSSNVEGSSATTLINPLHDYAPVNYIITLSCLSKDRFNTGAGSEVVVFKSGGKGVQGAGPLSKDYYVDNLVIRSSIAPSQETASATAFQILFDVHEPYGSSFVDALVQAALMQGYKNHLNAVFNIRIEFKGNDDAGQATNYIPNTTRDIPIHIYMVEMKIEAGISIYQIQAAPATGIALTDLYTTTQESVTITGDTVGDLLENFFVAYTQSLKTLQAEEDKKIDLTDEYILDTSASLAEVLDSPIGWTPNSSLASVVTVHNLKTTLPGTSGDASTRQVTVPKGTRIQTLIEAVVKESRYIRDQFDSDGIPKDDQIKLLKLETQLQLGEDNGNGRDQYQFIYILRTQAFNSGHTSKGNGQTVENIVPIKEYNYLYTGKNQDVLRFDITYKFAYYQMLPYLNPKGNDVVTEQQDGKASGESEGDPKPDHTGQDDVDGFATLPVNAGQQTFLPGLNTDNGEIVEIFQQMIQNPSADLLVTSVEIIGDPYWLPQQTVSNQSFRGSYGSTAGVDSKGAVTTENEVVIQLNFKQPVDLDDETGLFKNLNDVQGFQGKYRVYICESRFEQGIFTNILQMVRLHQQTNQITKESKDESSTAKNNSTTPSYAGGSKAGMANKQGVIENSTSNVQTNKTFTATNPNTRQELAKSGADKLKYKQKAEADDEESLSVFKDAMKRQEAKKFNDRLNDSFDSWLSGA